MAEMQEFEQRSATDVRPGGTRKAEGGIQEAREDEFATGFEDDHGGPPMTALAPTSVTSTVSARRSQASAKGVNAFPINE
ncbi:hypothetical protein BESB_062330 [Besnoitia besnoiti]|uniref:Uncharacterized protein n=1 Tax=Besnoitia besnoiti TaxID=94643 RepID=A0A2A9MHB6_BESBE|nr:hypothetical protein BESB_062330 [Besnoitia besnoiti]PFH35346.1 hypothetical protein BESB_062330 [Besnoitia besnoiti]